MIESADRTKQVKEYYFSRKLREIAEMNANGADVINLGIGSPDMPPHPSVINALCNTAQRSNAHAYQSYKGIPELRSAIAQWYDTHYQVELDADQNVLPLIGSKEGNMHIAMAFINEGDQVLIPNPGYPAYRAIANLVQAEVIEYNLIEANDWEPNWSELEKNDLSKVKLMWLNYPNMPTGRPASKSLFEKYINFAKRNNILLIHDNPYSFIQNDEPLSILSIDGAMDVALEMNSLSKSHNMAGWRVGMLLGKQAYIQEVLKVKSNMDSGMFRGIQEAAIQALALPKDWYGNLNSIYTLRKQKIIELLQLIGCSVQLPQNGLFVWAKVPDRVVDTEKFLDKILYESKVFVTPGFIFGSNGRRYVRASLCLNEPRITEALNRIKNSVEVRTHDILE